MEIYSLDLLIKYELSKISSSAIWWCDKSRGCFSALPGGNRNNNGSFNNAGNNGNWWSTTQNNSNNAYNRNLNYNNQNLNRNNNNKNNGFSVRCLRNLVDDRWY